MNNSIFISYPNQDQLLVENFRDELILLGVKVWMYSLDRTIAVEVWKEIEQRVKDSDVIIFIVSKNTPQAKGQERELEIALKKIGPLQGVEGKILPVFLEGSDILSCPEPLRRINGEYLYESSTKTIAVKLVKHLFPILDPHGSSQSWEYPRPGEWLKVSNIDSIIEPIFDLGDKLYFRSISPLGLYECYSPKLEQLYWISPENVIRSLDIEDDKKNENQIPFIYTIGGLNRILELGWAKWHEENE